MNIRCSKILVIVFTASLCAVAVGQSTLDVRNSAPLSVSLPFFVEDSHGKAVGGIKPPDLVVFDNKQLQSISDIRAAAELPLRLGVLIDTSTSESHSGVYKPAVEGIPGLLREIIRSADDRAFVITFDTVPNSTDLMTRDDLLKFRLDLALGGGTALYDAIYMACEERMGTDPISPARRVLVVLSDGADNSSHVNRNKVTVAAQTTRTVIFAISTNYTPSGDAPNWILEHLADDTGGRVFLHLGQKDIPKVFSTIQDQIENMYTVTYAPQRRDTKGQFRSFEVKYKSAKGIKVRSPKGYYVNATVK